MAEIEPIDQEAWEEWVSTRPDSVQDLCRRFPPNRLYRLKGGNRVVPYSYQEDGTLVVSVLGEYNLVTFERRVFGVKPEDLTECDLPGENEIVGVILQTEEEVDAEIERMRKVLGKCKHDQCECSDE